MLSKKELDQIRNSNISNDIIRKLVDELNDAKKHISKIQFFLDDGINIMEKAEKEIKKLRKAIKRHRENVQADGCTDYHNESLWETL